MRRRLALVLLLAVGCEGRAELLADRGDELLFSLEYAKAARQYELVLHECGEARDPANLALRIRSHLHLAAVRQHYLDDASGALQGYRAAIDLGVSGDSAVDARLDLVRLLRDRIGDVVGAANEMAALVAMLGTDPRRDALTLELAQLSFRAGRWSDAARYAGEVRKRADGADAVAAAMLVATAQEMQGRISQALTTYKGLESEVLPPTLVARVRFEIARCLERLGDLEAARRYYTAASAQTAAPQLVAARLERLERRIEAARTPTRGRASFQRARDSSHARASAERPAPAAPATRTKPTPRPQAPATPADPVTETTPEGSPEEPLQIDVEAEVTATSTGSGATLQSD